MGLQKYLNDDFDQRVIMHGADLPWIDSPSPGVQRRPLFRIGCEKARATTLVRYEPGSRFSAHRHPRGEEFLVLEGVFEDEHGRYPVGSYVRNPPGSQHTPGGDQGCTIFVRLRQFNDDDNVQMSTQLDGQAHQLLFENVHERVSVEQLSPAAALQLHNRRGLEVLVLDGNLEGDDFVLRPWSWMRLPSGMALQARAGTEGARIWVKDASLQL
ncbi:TPA: cupin domain-containing protein [Pseudomonas putida]